MSPSLVHQTHPKPVQAGDKRDFLDVFGVRLTPPFLEFQQAFEGRTYKQKLSIQNIGKSKIVVRITAPTSYAFKIKPVRGYNLSPGLTLVREVSCVFSYASSHSCIFAIYINGDRYDYQLFATVSYSKVIVTPKSIDFGSIDVGYASPARTLILKNEGSKPTRFYIDTAVKNDYTLIIEPNKGMLQANSSTSVSIRLIALREEILQMDLWVKAEKPNVVVLKAEAIGSRFEPVGSGLSTTFTLVDFPVTYLGLTSTETIYIRNFSASANMFCMMGEIDHNIASLDICRERHFDYNHFTTEPAFGMFQPRQVKAIHFKFQPKKPKPENRCSSYYFCTLHMCKIRSKFLTHEDYSELLSNDVLPGLFQPKFSWNSSCIAQQASDINHSILMSDDIDERSFVKPTEQCNCVKLHLHAIPETPQVVAVPDELTLTDLLMGQRTTRVLELRNCSENLPIIVIYKKVAYIDLDSGHIFIKANTSVQVAVYITPKKIGAITSHINFDLVYYDFPRVENDEFKVIGKVSVPIKFEVKAIPKTITPQINSGFEPKYVKEVGKFCHNLRFNSKQVKIPKTTVVSNQLVSKSSSALIALPNDMQRSIRPWRDKPKCKTIFTKMSRYVPPINSEYELTIFEKQVKIEQDNYYMNYIRQEAKRLKLAASVPIKKAAGDYEIDSSKKLLCKDLKLPQPGPVKAKETSSYTQYLPLLLDPLQIVNIIVDPLVVNTGPIAAHAKYEFTIKIKNNNKIMISVLIRPDKSNVFFPEGNKRMVKGRSEVAFPVVYVSTTVGFHTTELKFIINECAYIIVDVMANVCPVALKLDKTVIEFDSNNSNQYVKIINPLSTTVAFEWKLACNHFRIEPKEGYCKGGNSLLCTVEHLPDVDGPSVTDVDFSCVDKTVDQLRLITRADNSTLFFSKSHLILKDVPLNIPRTETVLLKNDSSRPQCYSLIHNEFNRYIKVRPSCGTVYPHSFNVLTLAFNLTDCVHFTVKLRFHVIRSQNIELKITGNVIYPDVVVWPSTLNFKKIPSSTTAALRFNIENKSAAKAIIAFDMSMYPDYVIAKSSKCCYTEVVETITIAKFSAVHLYAHFKPSATSCDKFILPMIINDILGPVTCNESRSVEHFLKVKVPHGIPNVLPHTLSVPTVSSYATEAKILLSRTHIKLNFAHYPKKCRNSYKLKISNPQNELEKFCIRTDDLKHPLYLTYTQEKKVVEESDNVVVCTLDPLEELFFDICFKPDHFGMHKALLPIFLQSDKSLKPHNYLYIEAVYEAPTITMDPVYMYCRPLPLRFLLIGSRKFTFMHHLESCKVEGKTSEPSIEVQVRERIVVDEDLQEVWIRGHSYSQDKGSFTLTVWIWCTCGGAYTTNFNIVTENCFLTNYPLVHRYVMKYECNLLNKNPSLELVVRPSLISLLSPIDKPKLTIEEDEVWKFYESYPFFPPRSNSVNDTDEVFVDFMETSIQVMESWICSQGFFGITYYNIPDGISHVRFINDENNKLKPRLPLVEMLINIIGEDAEQYFEVQTNTKFEANELEHAYIVYHIYKKVIEFLISQGALFACVHPAYLLPFNMYTLYIKNMAKMVADEKLLTIEDHSMFCRLGKQCWLDVVLQAYKVIVLKRVIQPYQGTSFNDEEALNDPTQKYRHSIKNIVRNSHLFSAPELLLLNWLEFHYNDERQKYWPDNPYLEYRKVSHFCENLEDGYVYAALTLAYCPYLQAHFKKMAPQPVSPEEILHNNALLVQSWEILNLNTGVTVRSMIEAHPLKTLVTIVYLFETLPNLHPKEKLELKAGLSAHITKSLILGNRNDFDVAYKAILYGNNDKCFSIKKDFFVIAPKTKCKIQVTYWAKFVKRSSCTLILSGECSGYRLAKSKVVTLSGEPNVSVVSASYEISTELYKIHDEKLIVRSPYPVPASYRIQHAYKNCLSSDDVDQLEYREDYRAFSLPRFISTITELVCNKNGEGELLVCVYPLTMRVIPATLYFRNQEVGDFAIKITTLTTPLLRQEILTVELPYGFGLSQTNDLEVFLEIPCQNHTMWKGIIEMLVKFAVTDVFFWKDVIRTTAGMHALQRLLCLTSEPYSHNIKFYEPCEFKIKPDKKSNVILPNTVYIADRCSSSCVKVPIIFKEKQHEAHDFAIILKSLDGLEIRHYKVCFVKRSESVSDNKNNV